MKNKGFTLIELLAVVSLLAILALLVTPKVLEQKEKKEKDIDEATKKILYSDAARYIRETDEESVEPGATFCVSVSDLIDEGYNSTKVDKYSDQIIKVSADENEKFIYSIGKSCDGTSKIQIVKEANATHKGIVYFDPTDLSKTCKQTDVVSTTGTRTGCMKWYIYGEEGNQYKLILDHNTTATSEYNSGSSYAQYDNAYIKTRITSDPYIQQWVSGLNPRIITANEIASITENTEWNNADATSSQYFAFGSNNTTEYGSQTAEQKAKQESLSWLFDYTNGCTSYGCKTSDSSTYGYWTSSSVKGSSNSAWVVSNSGRLAAPPVNITTSYGVRPVITMSKIKFSK